MATGVKICGLTEATALDAAVRGGASHVGFVFFAKSPRSVAPEAAGRLAAALRGSGVRTVAVVVDPSDVLVDEISKTLAPDFFQLHGDETPNRVREVAARSDAGVIKALPVSTAADVAAGLRTFDGAADHLLFDARAPQGADLPGGNGHAIDWGLLSGVRTERPWFLAGGLDPWNVADAVRVSGAPLVDVSTGVESGPGIKNPVLISAFISAVRKGKTS